MRRVGLLHTIYDAAVLVSFYEKGGVTPHYIWWCCISELRMRRVGLLHTIYDAAVLVSFCEKGGVRTHYNDASYEMHMSLWKFSDVAPGIVYIM